MSLSVMHYAGSVSPLPLAGCKIVNPERRDRSRAWTVGYQRAMAQIALDVKPSIRKGKGPTLSFENLSFKVGEREILKSMSAVIKPGEVVAIMGPSGGLRALSGSRLPARFAGGPCQSHPFSIFRACRCYASPRPAPFGRQERAKRRCSTSSLGEWPPIARRKSAVASL